MFVFQSFGKSTVLLLYIRLRLEFPEIICWPMRKVEMSKLNFSSPKHLFLSGGNGKNENGNVFIYPAAKTENDLKIYSRAWGAKDNGRLQCTYGMSRMVTYVIIDVLGQ